MKPLYLLIALVVTGSILKAQTNTFPSTGNVGIGTSDIIDKLTIGDYGGSITLRDRSTSVSGTSSLSKLKFHDYNGEAASISLEHNYYFGATPRALTFSVNGAERMRIASNGFIGIGTSTSSNPLTVPILSNGQGISLGTYATLSAGQFAFIGLTGADGTFNNGNLSGFDNGATGMAIVHTSGGVGNSAEIAFVTHNNGLDSRERLRIDRLGNVGIGTTSPNAKLSVNGNIRAKEVKVETANWPDYVFSKEYKLPSLQSTEQHIKEKGHLPGIPSAAEVQTNGVKLGEMNAKLLQKIEELTLYLIEMKKDAELQKKLSSEQINSLNKKIEKLETKHL